MRRELLIAAGPGEWRAAWLEDGAWAELYVERGDTRLAGGIHLGRVVRRAPGLDSVFVDIGDERPGLLPVREAAAHGTRLDEGGRVLVQVRREAQQGKGARLSTRLVPRPGRDLGALADEAARRDPPAQLDPPPGFAAALAMRMPAPPDRIRADNPAAIAELRAAFPGADIADDPEGPLAIDAAIDAALTPGLALGQGGAIHIAETRAAVLIDVDTGIPTAGSAAQSALAANLAAAPAIARRLRLANIGGGIVIDFVGLDGRGARERVREALAAAVRGDPAGPQVLGWTRLGHLELVRPRRGRSLSESLLDPEPGGGLRKHAVALAHEALRAVMRAARAQPQANWRLIVGARVEAALRGPARGALEALEARLARPIEIAVIAGHDQVFDIIAR